LNTVPAAYRYCPVCASELALATHGDRERLACPSCGWVHWNNPTPIVAAVLELEGKLLLARGRGWPEKMFALVTGFLEQDESPRDAVIREVKEETELDATSAALIDVYDFARYNQVIIAYHVVARGAVKLSDELEDYRLIAPEKVRPWPLGTGFAVADWLRARGLPVNFLEVR
jgi:NAD+ diphosphatase